MILGKEENPTLWKENLMNSIKDLSDIELQKLTWAGKHPNYISSLTEVLAAIYDDFDFERYIEYYESINGENSLSMSFRELNEMIKKRKDYWYKMELDVDGYNNILNDPNWIKITKKAKEVIDIWTKSNA